MLVLADMERAGIMIDPDLLRKLSNDFAQEQAKLEKQIHKLAGEEFNIGSPKQLGDILFGKILAARRAQDQDRRLVDRRRCAGRSGGTGP